jgi:uncharacterized protein GlcG (DUF336 family)
MFEEAKTIAAAAEKAAQEAGLNIVISIVDTHGNPVLLHRMDGAPLHSLDMAFRKAYTAASFDVSTAELTDQVQPGQPLYGLAVNSGSKLIAFGGGAPTTLAKGEKVGVGISGGTTQEDIHILQTALMTSAQH